MVRIICSLERTLGDEMSEQFNSFNEWHRALREQLARQKAINAMLVSTIEQDADALKGHGLYLLLDDIECEMNELCENAERRFILPMSKQVELVDEIQLRFQQERERNPVDVDAIASAANLKPSTVEKVIQQLQQQKREPTTSEDVAVNE